jgi:hypothetical protein
MVGEPTIPAYVITYAESRDDIEWRRENVTCIEPKSAKRPIFAPGSSTMDAAPHLVTAIEARSLPHRSRRERQNRLGGIRQRG